MQGDSASPDRLYRPMLLGESQPFSSPDYLYEVKLDGVRCVAYLRGGVKLMSRNMRDMTAQYPELAGLCSGVRTSCVLDGELAVIVGGRADFAAIRHRFAVQTAAAAVSAALRYPVQFFAFDILEADGEDLTALPLSERKRILAQTALTELQTAAFVEGAGEALFALAQSHNLEGIVAKRKTSRYHCGARTPNWLKIRNPSYTR